MLHYYISRKDRQECIVSSHLKSTAYRNNLSQIRTLSSAHSPRFPSLHLRHNSFSNPSVDLPTSKLILQPFRYFTYVTAHSPALPLLHLRLSSFSSPSFASPTSQALHLCHLTSRPGILYIKINVCVCLCVCVCVCVSVCAPACVCPI